MIKKRIEYLFNKSLLGDDEYRSIHFIYDIDTTNNLRKIDVTITPVVDLYSYFFDNHGELNKENLSNIRLNITKIKILLKHIINSVKIKTVKVIGRSRVKKSLEKLILPKIEGELRKKINFPFHLSKIKPKITSTTRNITHKNLLKKNNDIYDVFSQISLNKLIIDISLPKMLEQSAKKNNILSKLVEFKRDFWKETGLTIEPNYQYVLDIDIKDVGDDHIVDILTKKVKKEVYDRLNIKLKNTVFRSYKKTNDEGEFYQNYPVEHVLEMDVDKFYYLSPNFNQEYYTFFTRYWDSHEYYKDLSIKKGNEYSYVMKVTSKIVNSKNKTKHIVNYQKNVGNLIKNYIDKHKLPIKNVTVAIPQPSAIASDKNIRDFRNNNSDIFYLSHVYYQHSGIPSYKVFKFVNTIYVNYNDEVSNDDIIRHNDNIKELVEGYLRSIGKEKMTINVYGNN